MESKFDTKTHEILIVAREKIMANIYDCHDPKNKKAKGIYKENEK